MRSLRLDPELDEKVQRAAAVKGEWVSVVHRFGDEGFDSSPDDLNHFGVSARMICGDLHSVVW